jgi:hypothetical protein
VSIRSEIDDLILIEQNGSIEELTAEITFRRCAIIGPDGKRRQAWEAYRGNMCLGRADSKELLETCCAAQEEKHKNPYNFHWRQRKLLPPLQYEES